MHRAVKFSGALIVIVTFQIILFYFYSQLFVIYKKKKIQKISLNLSHFIFRFMVFGRVHDRIRHVCSTLAQS